MHNKIIEVENGYYEDEVIINKWVKEKDIKKRCKFSTLLKKEFLICKCKERFHGKDSYVIIWIEEIWMSVEV